MRLNLLLFLYGLLVCASCEGQSAQQPAGDPVAALDSAIWVIYQGKDGVYWFGSDGQGLYRYDTSAARQATGRSLLHFTTRHGLSGDRVRAIQEDRQGNMFISTLGGISRYDGRAFSTLRPVESQYPEEHWRLDSNDLWFSILGGTGERGPYRYDGQNLYRLRFPKSAMEDSFRAANPAAPFSPTEAYSIYRDRSGAMWFGTACLGACRYDGRSWAWLYEKHLTEPPGGGSFGIRSIREDRHGDFWICNTKYRFRIAPGADTGNGLVNYQRATGIQDLQAPDGSDQIYAQSIVEDAQGCLWMLTYGWGIWRYDPSAAAGERIRRYAVKNGTQDVKLFALYQDQQGILWAASPEGGAFRFDGKEFVAFRP